MLKVLEWNQYQWNQYQYEVSGILNHPSGTACQTSLPVKLLSFIKKWSFYRNVKTSVENVTRGDIGFHLYSNLRQLNVLEQKCVILKTPTYTVVLLPYILPASCSYGLPEPQPTLYSSFDDKGSWKSNVGLALEVGSLWYQIVNRRPGR